MKSNSRVLRGWRDFGVKATAIILTILLATQMVGTPAFASGALTNKQASEDIAMTVDDTGVEPSGTEATDTTVPDEAAGAANEPAPADSTQATEEPVAETVESATEPATETPAADPAANAVLGAEPEPAPAPAVEQGQLASIELNLADGASITLSKDGNKIDDDTNPVDVPANEELKFTAQAAEGWQVDKVKTVIDGVETELTADANGEYKVAADKVTDKLTVKVEAVEVVESEASAEEPAVVANDIAIATAPQMLSIRAVTWGSFSAVVELYDENMQSAGVGEGQTVSGGAISENVKQEVVQGGITYDFVGAYVGDNKIEFAGSRPDGGVYYAVEVDSGIASQLADGQQITLRYQEHVDRHNITYSITGIADTDGLVSGASNVVNGGSFDFTVRDVYGYEVSVSATTGQTLTGSNGVYSISNVTNDVTVNVAYLANSSYDFVISDTVRNSANAHGMMGYGAVPNQSNIAVGNDLIFSFSTVRGQGGADWYLDSLEINDQTVAIPRTYSQGDSATTTLDNGLTVVVTLTEVDDNGHWDYGWPGSWDDEWVTEFPEYTYTVTVSGAKEDIELTFINFVGSGHHEVMPHFDKNAVSVAYTGNGEVNEPAQNEKPIQTTNGTVYFNIDALPGYEITGVTLDGQTLNPNGQGQYAVVNNDEVVKHLDIFSRAIAYSAQYDMNGVSGTAPTDSIQYGIALEQNLVIAGAPETEESKVFLGWEIGGRTYQPGEVIPITDIIGDAHNGTLKFTAQWGDTIPEGVPVTMYVEVYLQQTNGEYALSQDLSTEEFAYGGDTVTVRDPESYLNELENYTFNDEKTDDYLILVGSNDTLKLYFDLNKASYTVNYYIEGTTEKVPGIDPNPVTGTGYVGQEIDIAHPVLTTGYVVCDDQPTKLTVTNDGLATATVYYRVDQTQDEPDPTPDPDPTPTPTPDTPTPLPTPGTPTPVPTPVPGGGGTTPTDGLTATTGDDAEEAIDDEATPLTAPEPIDDDATPLAANEHRDCWVHWLMLLGILVTVVYYGGVGVRRVRFSSSLQSFEDDVLGNDETNR